MNRIMNRIILVIALSVFISSLTLLETGAYAKESKDSQTKDFMKIHKEIIVIDGCVPLMSFTKDPKHFDWFIEGGATVLSVTVSGAPTDLDLTTELISWLMEQIMTRDDLTLIRTTEDIKKAKREGKLGVFFHLQNPAPLENDLDRLWYYKALGVGLIQFAYNTRSPYANGITERVDGGLSTLGLKLVEACNEARMIIDIAHVGEQSALEMIKASKEIVVLSHGNARGAIDSPRNVSDKVLKAIAENGGVAGVVGYPPFVSKSAKPTMDDMLNMVDYMVKLMGIDHVAFGIDYDATMHSVLPDETVLALYKGYVASGAWDPSAYPEPPYYYPEGIEFPSTLHNLTKGLLERGYTKEDIEKLWGGNWMRVMKQVWDDPKAHTISDEKSGLLEE